MSAGVSCLSVHPGNLLATALHRHSPLHWLASRLGRPWAKSPSQAAASTVMACCSEEPLLQVELEMKVHTKDCNHKEGPY